MAITRMLGAKEAAAIVGLNLRYFKDLLQNGEGPAHYRRTPRAHYRFVEADLLEWKNKHRREH